MNNQEFVSKLLNIVNNYKTIYAYGTWGQVLNNDIINSKAKQYPSWYTSSKQKELKNLVGKGYFVFDCVGLIKGVLWGWNGSNTRNGGAVYQSNGVPDVSANGMIAKCTDVSTNFSNIEMGEVVWMDGHIGVYYKDSQVIECSPAFQNKVQITKLSQRSWKKHGKLPYIKYATPTPTPTLLYRAYVENTGWTEWISSGVAGSTGKSKGLNAIEIKSNKDVYAKAHISNIGWKDYGKVNDGKQIGEDKQRLECLCLKGDFKYRVHIAYFGWTNWTEADGVCTLGSVGMSWNIEAIEIAAK